MDTTELLLSLACHEQQNLCVSPSNAIVSPKSFLREKSFDDGCCAFAILAYSGRELIVAYTCPRMLITSAKGMYCLVFYFPSLLSLPKDKVVIDLPQILALYETSLSTGTERNGNENEMRMLSWLEFRCSLGAGMLHVRRATARSLSWLPAWTLGCTRGCG